MNTTTNQQKAGPTVPAWPYLARTMKKAEPNKAFGGPPAGREVCVYAAGCPGLQQLGLRTRASLHKVGVTTADLRYRLKQMNMDRYGSLHDAGAGLVASAGFNDWSAQPLQIARTLAVCSPVRVAGRGLRVTLPDTLRCEFRTDRLPPRRG